MLQIKNIKKKYETGDLIQTALDDVSVNLRDNEFVAILGPSGSGKTTLLNIIGGLDRYDSGDLIINNISTKKYKDRDWDSYRNHTIGFVFQSYYLIPHQSVLSNVELALTISGISRAERRERAKKALEEVGLGEQIHKKPTQMSGGQMQRVAIARALVNNPDILLADEPTGALDTKTSVQVMELLKEVAKDRLVVMVTHNPELAEEYATRIIKLKDGKITDDSDPFEPEIESEAPIENHNMGKSSMSVGTAVSLSFNNLKTKIARTLLTSFAGSIGIIGIAMILSLSTGVNKYIDDIQEDTMTSYPIQINEQAMDLSQFIARGQEAGEDRIEEIQSHERDAVYSNSMALEMATTMNSSITTNNLTLFKEYLDDESTEIHKYLSDEGIIYSYNTKFDVFAYDKENKFFNTNPYAGGQTISSSLGTYSMETSFNQNFTEMLPGVGDELVSEQIKENYELIYGSWPTSDNDVVLVVNVNNEVDLSSLYELGYLSIDDYNEMTEKFTSMESFEFDDVVLQYDEVVGQTFYLMTEADMYVENKDGLFEYIGDDSKKVEQNLSNGIELHISGIIRVYDRDNASIFSPIAYTNALTHKIMQHTAESPVVKAQMADKDTNVVNGYSFIPATDEEKIAEVKKYLDNMTVSDKAEMYMGIVTQYMGGDEETMAQLGQMPEQDLANMFDQAVTQNLDDAAMLEYYDEYISAGSYDANMEAFGYVDEECPSSINIYTDSFENKDNIARCIDEYNDAHEEADQITYTDYIGLLLSSVTTIINVISYVLIAFVAVSLVVSSIMIGIITYISVLERTKEIGILRAIGASKKNISLVFNAETFIIGLCSGLMGVFVTWILLFPANAIIHSIADNQNVNAFLPLPAAVILVILSVVLTFIGGLIPSSKAAKMDPVAALRTE